MPDTATFFNFFYQLLSFDYIISTFANEQKFEQCVKKMIQTFLISWMKYQCLHVKTQSVCSI